MCLNILHLVSQSDAKMRKLQLLIISPSFSLATTADDVDVLPQIRSWNDVLRYLPVKRERPFDLLSVEPDFQEDPSDLVPRDRNANGLKYATTVLQGFHDNDVEWELSGIGFEKYIDTPDYVRDFSSMLAISGHTADKLTPEQVIKQMIAFRPKTIGVYPAIQRLLPNWREKFLVANSKNKPVTDEAFKLIQCLKTLENVDDKGIAGISLRSVFADLFIKMDRSPSFFPRLKVYNEIISWLNVLSSENDPYDLENKVSNIITAYKVDDITRVDWKSAYSVTKGDKPFKVSENAYATPRMLIFVLAGHEYIKQNQNIKPKVESLANKLFGDASEGNAGRLQSAFRRGKKNNMAFEGMTAGGLLNHLRFQEKGGHDLCDATYHKAWDEWVGKVVHIWKKCSSDFML